MALAPLASILDLSARPVEIVDSYLAERMLLAASAAIRDAAGSAITEVSSTVTIEAGEGQRLRLPAQPVSAVDSVTMDGSPVTDYVLASGDLWRARGWRRGHRPTLVEVTFTHGMAEAPDDIKELTLDLAIAGMNVAADGAHSGVAYESIDDYRVGYLQGREATASVWELPERTRLALRQRFGSAAHVTSEAT